jgi:hypothetical protein
MAQHLTPSDVHFLASVTGDTGRKFEDLVTLAGEVDALADEYGLDVVLPALDALAADESDADELVDQARSQLARAIGLIRRGEIEIQDQDPEGSTHE